MPLAASPANAPPAPLCPTRPADPLGREAILAWFRAEFAAANAIIDALCAHLAQLGEFGEEYEDVFAAIHRRRLNWIPVLQMQKYHSIADVAVELKKAASERKKLVQVTEEITVGEETGLSVNGDDDGSIIPVGNITNSVGAGSHEAQTTNETTNICSNHEECNARMSLIKLTKGFNAKEQVKRHMVNVVKGLKLYEDVFTDSELSKLRDFMNELRVAGQNGELSGETFVLFNKQMKGNRRELIQFGIPIFGHIKEENSSSKQATILEPIPALLQGIIDHLVQWRLIPEYRRPNGCIIHLFDEGEYSQPFLKPPHLEQPISTLVLSESTMAFGRTLVSDDDGNYRGPLMLAVKAGSLLVMRGNSADLARHVMCHSTNRRVCISFFRVRPDSNQGLSPPTSPMAGAMTVWQPSIQCPYPMNGVVNGYETMGMIPKWGVLRSPLVMLAPMRPMVLNPERMPLDGTGTGVYLPWNVGSRKSAKHLPPRAQRNRLLALTSSVGVGMTSSMGIKVEGK